MSRLSDLMAQRICDLGLVLEKSRLYPRVIQLYKELAARNLPFRPPCYFADEWFVPEGDPVIGIPFYLATPDLVRLEKRMMGEVEGASYAYFMKLLRHEAGHAISYAYAIHRKRAYKRVFGPSSKLFTDIYTYYPHSKRHVIHLRDYYAQSHPDEDFAETFAVWLGHPRSTWRAKYHGWKALKKLEWIDARMTEIAGKKPIVKTGEKMCHVSTLKYTVWTYYMRRRSLIETRRASGR